MDRGMAKLQQGFIDSFAAKHRPKEQQHDKDAQGNEQKHPSSQIFNHFARKT
jgi:hypothetical protein